jgi:hypothetical protein
MGVARSCRLGCDPWFWSWLFAWLWVKCKLLIPGNFLALAVALAITDSKGLLGFGDAALRDQVVCFQCFIRAGGFGSENAQFALFSVFVG